MLHFISDFVLSPASSVTCFSDNDFNSSDSGIEAEMEEPQGNEHIFSKKKISIPYLCHISKGMFYILNWAVVLLFAGYMDLKSKNDWLGFLIARAACQNMKQIWLEFFFPFWGEIKRELKVFYYIQSEAMVQYITVAEISQTWTRVMFDYNS